MERADPNGSVPRSGSERSKDWYARLTSAQKAARVQKAKEKRQKTAALAKSNLLVVAPDGTIHSAGSAPPPPFVSAPVTAGSNMAALAEGDEMVLADDVSALSLSNGGNTKASRKQFFERMEQISLARAQARGNDVAAADTKLDQEDTRNAQAQKEAFESFTKFCGDFGGAVTNIMKDAYVHYSGKIQEDSNKKQDRINSKQALDMKARDRHLEDADEAAKASMREQLCYGGDDDEEYDEEENYDALF